MTMKMLQADVMLRSIVAEMGIAFCHMVMELERVKVDQVHQY